MSHYENGRQHQLKNFFARNYQWADTFTFTKRATVAQNKKFRLQEILRIGKRKSKKMFTMGNVFTVTGKKRKMLFLCFNTCTVQKTLKPFGDYVQKVLSD